jgi:hypothetical protein
MIKKNFNEPMEASNVHNFYPIWCENAIDMSEELKESKMSREF